MSGSLDQRTVVSSGRRSPAFVGLNCLLIPTTQGHINKQMQAGIAMEITGFEDTAKLPLTTALRKPNRTKPKTAVFP